jgi:isopenicillin-N epimerase
LTDASVLRRHWTLDEHVVFLNHGSFGACPRPVLEAAARVRAELEREPVYFFERTFPAALDAARAEVAAFVGARFEDLVFVPNTTAGVNAILRSAKLGPGDTLLTTDHAYNACTNALEFVAARTGARVTVVPVPLPLSDPEEVVERILGGATGDVRLALIDHVTSQTGVVFPIARIVARLRERGIETLVDGAHAPGMLPLDVAAIGAAYYVGNFHKWLCAPKGAAMLWARSDVQAGLHPTSISHGYSSSRARARFLEEFDWTGSTDPAPFLAVPDAIRFVGGLLPGGWPEIYARNRGLALAARRLLSERLGATLLAPESMIGSLASVPLPDSAPGEPTLPAEDLLHRALADVHSIEVPVFPWPSPPRRLVRVSAHLYNELADYRRLAEALEGLLGRRAAEAG